MIRRQQRVGTHSRPPVLRLVVAGLRPIGAPVIDVAGLSRQRKENTMTDYVQARKALKSGNARRLAMARSKTSLKRLPTDEAFRQAAVIVTDPDEDQGAIRVHQLLAACPRLGEVGISHALMYAGIMRPDKRLRDLTDRQRNKLAEALRTAAAMGPMNGLRALRRGDIAA